MDEMPAGRLPVETHVIHPLERERAYSLIRARWNKASRHLSFTRWLKEVKMTKAWPPSKNMLACKRRFSPN